MFPGSQQFQTKQYKTLTLSLWLNIRSLSTRSTKQWMNERPPKLVLVPIPPYWKIYLGTNGAARTWQGPECKVLRWGHKKKHNNGLESLKLVQSAIERYLKENSPQLPIVQSRKFHNSKEIHRRIAPAAPSNSFSNDNEMSQPQPKEKGRFSIIDSGDENRNFMHESGCFRSHFRTACLFVMLEWVFVTWHRFEY